MATYTLGIDLGSRTAKAVLYNIDEKKIASAIVTDTTADSKNDAKRVQELALEYAGILPSDLKRTIATGYGRGLVDFACDTTTEITCHAVGVHLLVPQARTIIDIGGQDSKSIHLNADGTIRDFSMNDRCAAGTGRFLEVVSKLLGTNLDGMARLAEMATDVPEISSMCVVFAESEVIGMLAKGIRREELSAGIHKSIARRVAGLAERGRIEPPVAFTGGVAKDMAMIRALGAELHEKLLIPPDPRITGALGAAIIAARQLGEKGYLACTEFKTINLQQSFPETSQKREEQDMLIVESIKGDCCPWPPPAKDSSECCHHEEQQVCCGSETQKQANYSGNEEASCCSSANVNEAKQSCCGEAKPAPHCGESQPEPCHSSEKESTCESEPVKTQQCNSTTPQGGMHSVPSLSHFDRMIPDCIELARQAKSGGKKVVSIFCEYTPRELILAAGAIPVCACGGNHSMAVASEKELPANLCPLIKSSYGYHTERANPIFNESDLIVCETTCDGKKKMYELMSKTKPMHILELTQKPDEEAAFEHWLLEVKALKKRLEELTGNEITEERLRAAIRTMNRERALRSRIADFGGKCLTGMEVLHAKSIISCQEKDFEAYEKIISEAENSGDRYSHKPRILLTGVPLPHQAEKVLKLIEEAGAVVVAQENCTGLKPVVDPVSEEGDLLENIARKYFKLPCSVMMPNKDRFGLLDSLIEKFRPHGVIDLVWQACHTYNIESVLVKKHIQEKWGLPFLKIETDYSPSDTEQLRVRIEAFLSVASQNNLRTSY
ncbi:MAG: double-cubane-cluster-containing anaerobic reductase [Caldisericales bacterium]|nr:2-hydroxyacyl-CoA dehydratase [bacterium]